MTDYVFLFLVFALGIVIGAVTIAVFDSSQMTDYVERNYKLATFNYQNCQDLLEYSRGVE